MKHRISTDYYLQFYGCDQGIHIMVYENSAPLTCKKERLRPMRDFLSQPQGTAFRGGLILERESESIAVIAKKNHIGSVPVSVFEKAIEKAASKQLPYYEPAGQA